MPDPDWLERLNEIKKHVLSNEDRWGTSQFSFRVDRDDTYLALRQHIRNIRFVAARNPDDQGTNTVSATNHWTLFFDTSADASVPSSTEVDMCPNEPGEPGMIVLERKACRPLVDQVHEAECLVLEADATIVDFLEVILKNERDKYIFSPNSEGCRFWLTTVAGDFVEAGLIRAGDAEDAKGALKKYWKDPKKLGYEPDSASEERTMDKGVFFGQHAAVR
ncbi:hypothetical protein EIP91_003295 [Steccherinum ochraceum]|uniref:DUF7770 domain-containing protein n=1 Tax=Steccherinum ochraceum TaxID=92696 RepID=A0A4V2MW65_9APHY|nr:hypothetical protein EIP91_003295 [Steccherinum ochraceum]